MKRKKTNVAAAVLSCSLGLSTISPVLAEENISDSTQSLVDEIQIVELSIPLTEVHPVR